MNKLSNTWVKYKHKHADKKTRILTMERRGELKFLPCEIWLMVFEKLSFKDLYNVALVSKEWKKLGLDLNIWKKFVIVKKEKNLDVLDQTCSIPRLGRVERIEFLGSFVHESVFMLHKENYKFIFDKHFRMLGNLKLKQISFSNCDLTSISPKLLGTTLNQLEHVSIQECIITDEQIEEILESMLDVSKLKVFLLDTVFVQNQKSDSGEVNHETFAIALSKLEHLQIRSVLKKTEYLNFFESNQAHFDTFFKTIDKETNLKNLDIDCELLNLLPTAQLISSLNKLQVVNLSSSSINALQCKELASAISDNPSIRELFIPMADMSLMQPHLFASALSKLSRLDISGARVDRHQMSELFKAIVRGSSLKELDIRRISIDGINANIVSSALILIEEVSIFHPSSEQIRCLLKKMSLQKSMKLKSLSIDEGEMFHAENSVISKSVNKLKSFQVTNSFFVFDLMQRIPENLTSTFITMSKETLLQEIRFVDINLSKIPSNIFGQAVNRMKKVSIIRGSLSSAQITSFFTSASRQTAISCLDLTGNDLSGLPARTFLAKPLIRIKSVTLVNTNLLRKQIEAILNEISTNITGADIEYLNIKQNDVSKVSPELMDEVKCKLKHCLVDEYLDSDDDFWTDEDETSNDDEQQPNFIEED